ncbi:hypothetical protein MASR2M39_14880 [Ignavibacteriales bacterium]
MTNEIIHFRKVSGVNETTDPVYLENGEVCELVNFVLDHTGAFGTPVRRGNWSTLGAPLPSGSIKGILSVVSANKDTYLVAISEGKLWLSKNGSGEWSLVYEGELSGETFGALMTNGGAIIHSGYNSLFLSGDEMENSQTLSIKPPVINGALPLKAVHYSTGGEIGAGWYNYVVVYEAVSGDHSSPSQPFTAYRDFTTGSTGFSGSTNKVEILDIPVPTDNRVVKKKIFRTRAILTSDLSNSPFLYYELAILEPATTAYTDTTSDDNLSSSSIALFVADHSGLSYSFHKGRLFSSNLKLPVVNFLSPPFSYDGSGDKVFSGTGVITGGEIANASSYRYRLVYVEENGIESDFIETQQILTPGEEWETLAMINLDYIPFLPSSESRRVVAKRLYRTKKDGNTFYQHPVILSHNQISFTDKVADSGLESGKIHATDIAIKEYKSSLLFSEPGEPFTFLPESIISLLPEGGDEIMNLFDDLDGVLIFKRRSIHKLFTSGDPATWRIVTVAEGIGQGLTNGIVKTDRGIYFYSGGSIHLYSGGTISNPGNPIRATLKKVHKFFVSGWFSQKEWCCFPVEVTGGSTILLIHDLKVNCWYRFTHPGLTGIISLKQEWETLLSFAGGQMVKYDETSLGPDIIDELDIEVQATHETGKYSNPTFSIMRLRKIWLYLTTLAGAVKLSILTDEGEASTVFTFDSAAEQTEVLPTSALEASVDFCREFSFKVSGTGIKKLNGVKLESRRVRE